VDLAGVSAARVLANIFFLLYQHNGAGVTRVS
jgi:hypothetical protein